MSKFILRFFAVTALGLFLGAHPMVSAFAAPDWQTWVEGADYDPEIPTLDAFLERPFAERHSTVDEILEYAFLLTTKSPRVSLEVMGESVQGDPLTLLVLTAPENLESLDDRLERLDFVRDAWENSADARRSEAEGLLPVTWIACSVHGDEASGSDAGLALAYHLAADRSAATRDVLEKSIVLIGVSHNPDGRRRFLQHVRSFGRAHIDADPSPWASEHSQLWPGGRTNHFLFDLNRDWAFLTQQETRAHVAAFLRWRPQVFVDLHEMFKDSSYFFPPPADPINPHIPREHLHWFEVFGRANAEAFDARGFDYFVRESFDLFYPGYGDSWPTLQGAVGMTYEQATTRGRTMRQADGRVVGYDDAVQRHFIAALTTAITAAREGRALLDGYVDFHTDLLRRSRDDARKELVISAATHGAEARRLAEILARQGIEVLQTETEAEVRLAGYDDDSGTEHDVRIPAGSYRVPLAQPGYALVRSLLDPHTPMDEDFLEQERERRKRGLHSRFYDVTAWSLIFSYGLEAHVAFRDLDVPSTMVQPDLVVGKSPADAIPEAPRAGWIVPFEDNASLQALLAFWEEGLRVRCALDSFEQGDRAFPRGSLVIRRAANAEIDDLDGRVRRAAERAGVELVGADSAWSDTGISLGSDRVRPLLPPTIALVTGPGVKPASAGGLNWLFEERYAMDFSTVLLDNLKHVDLADFDVLVVPELSRGRELPVEALNPWVESGGLLVLIGSATASVVPDAGKDDEDADRAWTTVEYVRDLALLTDEEGMLGDEVVGSATETVLAGPLPPERRPLRTPGAILRVRLDPTHYLSFGEGESVFAPVLSDRLLTPSVGGHTVAVIDPDAPRRAGFIWPVMEEALKGKAYLVEEVHGRGHVLLFAEDPGFRGTWEGLHRMLLNGVLLGPSLSR